MMVYLLFYDTDEGDREEWNTFYTPCEAFANCEARSAREAELRKDPDLSFHLLDLEILG